MKGDGRAKGIGAVATLLRNDRASFFLAKYDKNTRDFILLFAFFSVQYKMAIYKVGKNRLQRREIV